IRRNAEQWHVDPEGIFLCGFSAGGHLAASLGIFWDSDFLLMKTGLSKEDIRPAGLILAYPVISSGEYGH
ncbi:alpha/beta hydrolase, partial [Intestinimonas butyriciproducens]